MGLTDRSEFLDSVEDAELPGCRGYSRDDVILENDRVGRKEFEDNRKVPSNDQTKSCDTNRRSIDSKHHLIWINIWTSILLVDFVLPLRGEGIKRDVHEKEDQPNKFSFRVSLGIFAGDRKYRDPDCDEQCFNVL